MGAISRDRGLVSMRVPVLAGGQMRVHLGLSLHYFNYGSIIDTRSLLMEGIYKKLLMEKIRKKYEALN